MDPAIDASSGLRVLEPTTIGTLALENRVFQSARSANFGADRAGPSGRYIAYQELTGAVHAHGAAIFARRNEPGRHLRLDRSAAVSAYGQPWSIGGVVPHALTSARRGRRLPRRGARRGAANGLMDAVVDCCSQ